MKYPQLLFSIFLLGYLSTTSAQKIITGKVVDSLTSETLKYVNIGIKNKNIGTVSDGNGNFHISIPLEYTNDTLVFSYVGYKEASFRIDDISPESQIIKLTGDITKLDDVEISAERLVEKKFGIKRRNLVMHFSDGMFQENDVFEIGQLIKLNGSKAQVTSVNLYLFDSSRDSITFRINFYELEEGIPSKRLNHKGIIQQHPLEEGWLRLDISQELIVLEEDFVVTLEFIPDESGSDKKVYYEVKLGGSSRSYYRKSSLGTWNTPPHHYCMYVTALMDKSMPDEPEEIETLPITSIWSEQVRDLFNVFLKLPTDYEKKRSRSYPVIYCLDANAYFDHICQIVSDLSEKKMLKIEPIIVGIGYENAYVMDSLRVRDYTYPVAPVTDSLSVSGGGENFYSFIKSVVVPYIDHTYRTDVTNRTIMGHSFGGYFVAYSMLCDLTGDKIFENYIAASPSLWYSNGYILERLNSLPPSDNTLTHASLFLTSGEEELKYGNETHFRTFRESIQKLKSIELAYKIYPNLDHMGAAVPSFEDAIEVLFGKKPVK